MNVFGFEGVQNARFDASADQALFLRNGELLGVWVASNSGLSDRLAALDNGEVAEEFYLSVFSRLPSADEAKPIEDLLDHSQRRKADIQHLVWAGLVSSEFRLNYSTIKVRGESSCDGDQDCNGIDHLIARRDFLVGTAAGAIGMGALSRPSSARVWSSSKNGSCKFICKAA